MAVSYVGSGYATYTVDMNNTGGPRTGYIRIAGQTVTISQDGPVNWNGTWAGTITGTWTASGCSWNGTVSFTMTISTSGSAVSGSGALNGDACFNLGDCSIDSFPNSSGTVSGSTSGQTINISYSGTAIGGLCDGGGISVSFTGTLSGTTITGHTSDGKQVHLTKQ